MGVPSLFRYLTRRYPKVTYEATQDDECDCFYIDMNDLVHYCTHPEHKKISEERQMFENLFAALDRLVKLAKPLHLLYLAIDGVAPRAKLNQQRSRRFRSGRLKSDFDTNKISPGTEFMRRLNAAVRTYIQNRISQKRSWRSLRVIFSDSTVPGEGEHKFLGYMRAQKAQNGYVPQRHVVYGHDADLIMLSLTLHELHVKILRRDVFYIERIMRKKPNNSEELIENAPHVYFDTAILREYIELEFKDVNAHLERIIDDWVLLCFFVGNDFLPHLPSLDIRQNALSTLIGIFKVVYRRTRKHLNNGGVIDYSVLSLVLEMLSKNELTVMRKRQSENREERVDMSLRNNEDRSFRNNEDRSSRNNEDRSFRNNEDRSSRNNEDRSFRNSEDRNSRNNEDRSFRNNEDRNSRNNEEMQLKAPAEIKKIVITPYNTSIPGLDSENSTENMKIEESLPEENDSSTDTTATIIKNKEESDSTTVVSNNKQESDSIDLDSNNANNREEESELASSDSSTRDSLESELKSKASLHAPKCNEDCTIEGEDVPEDYAMDDAFTTSEEELDETTKKILEQIDFSKSNCKETYYSNKVQSTTKESIRRVCNEYLDGLSWVLGYYYLGLRSWSWYYPYHYAPFCSELAETIREGKRSSCEFVLGQPLEPFMQLLAIMPESSYECIPESLRSIMSKEGALREFYPENFVVDLNGKKVEWQGVCIIPFVDETRLMAEYVKLKPYIPIETLQLNLRGKDTLYVHRNCPLYSVIHALYEKETGKKKLTQHIFGTIIQDSYAIISGLHVDCEYFGRYRVDTISCCFIDPVVREVNINLLSKPRRILTKEDQNHFMKELTGYKEKRYYKT